MQWRPILQGAEAERARTAIAAIVTALPIELADPTLIRGWAGVALLHGALARDGDPDAPARARQAIERALDAVAAEDRPPPWLGTGFVGVAWVMDDVSDVVAVDQDSLEQIDAMVGGLVGRDRWAHEYELWAGIVGLGLYALARGRTDDVDRVIGHLDALAHGTPEGVTWWNRDFVDFTDPRIDPRGYHNVGLALGVCGVITFLAEAIAAGVTAPRARPLLASAVAWVRAQERTATTPRFPGCLGLEIPPHRLRNGWCYGDLAVACALVRAGVAASESAWVAAGHAIALAMARGSMEDVPDLDAAFCHGTAGRAHMLNRLGHALDDAELLDSARRYAVETLDRLETLDLAVPSLTMGTAGIALALLAAVSPHEPRWDRVLLVALPPA